MSTSPICPKSILSQGLHNNSGKISPRSPVDEISPTPIVQNQAQSSCLDTLCAAAKSMMGKYTNQSKEMPCVNNYGLLDIWENEDAIVLYVDAPGLQKESIDILIEDDHLLIIASRPSDLEEDEVSIYSERYQKVLKRSILLPSGIDVDSVSSSYKDGVIQIKMMKIKEKEVVSRKIHISSNV